MLEKVKSKFLLSNAAAGRAKQIMEGSLPYVSDFDPSNPIETALKEIESGKIKVKILKEPVKIKKEEQRESIGGLERLEKKEHRKYKRRK